MSRRTVKGFTLIELLVVILILGILAAIALPMYLSSIATANKRTCHANMKTIATAMQSFITTDYGHKYPTDLAALCVGPKSSATATAVVDLQSPGPVCPEDPTPPAAGGSSATDTHAYTFTDNTATGGTFTITCNSDATNHGVLNNGVFSLP